jgi:hypothetical protein
MPNQRLLIQVKLADGYLFPGQGECGFEALELEAPFESVQMSLHDCLAAACKAILGEGRFFAKFHSVPLEIHQSIADAGLRDGDLLELTMMGTNPGAPSAQLWEEMEYAYSLLNSLSLAFTGLGGMATIVKLIRLLVEDRKNRRLRLKRGDHEIEICGGMLNQRLLREQIRSFCSRGGDECVPTKYELSGFMEGEGDSPETLTRESIIRVHKS